MYIFPILLIFTSYFVSLFQNRPPSSHTVSATYLASKEITLSFTSSSRVPTSRWAGWRIVNHWLPASASRSYVSGTARCSRFWTLYQRTRASTPCVCRTKQSRLLHSKYKVGDFVDPKNTLQLIPRSLDLSWLLTYGAMCSHSTLAYNPRRYLFTPGWGGVI